MKPKKIYLTPETTVLSVRVESGFTMSVLTNQGSSVSGENTNGQYQEASGWSTAFGTGGSGTGYF